MHGLLKAKEADSWLAYIVNASNSISSMRPVTPFTSGAKVSVTMSIFIDSQEVATISAIKKPDAAPDNTTLEVTIPSHELYCLPQFWIV